MEAAEWGAAFFVVTKWLFILVDKNAMILYCVILSTSNVCALSFPFWSKGTTTVYVSSIKHQEFKYHGRWEVAFCQGMEGHIVG